MSLVQTITQRQQSPIADNDHLFITSLDEIGSQPPSKATPNLILKVMIASSQAAMKRC